MRCKALVALGTLWLIMPGVSFAQRPAESRVDVFLGRTPAADQPTTGLRDLAREFRHSYSRFSSQHECLIESGKVALDVNRAMTLGRAVPIFPEVAPAALALTVYKGVQDGAKAFRACVAGPHRTVPGQDPPGGRTCADLLGNLAHTGNPGNGVSSRLTPSPVDAGNTSNSNRAILVSAGCRSCASMLQEHAGKSVAGASPSTGGAGRVPGVNGGNHSGNKSQGTSTSGGRDKGASRDKGGSAGGGGKGAGGSSKK